MTKTKRRIEIFSAGCACCEDAIEAIRAAACPSCGVEVRDMRDAKVAADAKRYGVNSVPAVVIDGKLAECCKRGGGVDIAQLRSMGLGQP
jgi:glutaredoxin